MEDTNDSPIEIFSNQVGGHTFELQNQGILHQGRYILKQLQDLGRGDKEVLFYENILNNYPEFCQWIAGYHGIKSVSENGVNGNFMILDDLTFGYDKPCIIDLKIGTQTWEDDAPLEKIERESKKYPLQRKIGFRLTGMRVFNQSTQEYEIYDKKYGYSLCEDNLNSFFAAYFSHIDMNHKRNVVKSIIDDLYPLLKWFEEPDHLLFICTSILIIFEGRTEADFRPIVRLVDFAHVKQLSDNKRDEGCIIGIKRIISELELLYASL